MLFGNHYLRASVLQSVINNERNLQLFAPTPHDRLDRLRNATGSFSGTPRFPGFLCCRTGRSDAVTPPQLRKEILETCQARFR